MTLLKYNVTEVADGVVGRQRIARDVLEAKESGNEAQGVEGPLT